MPLLRRAMLVTFAILMLACGFAFATPAPDVPAYQVALSEFQSGQFREATETLRGALQERPQSVSAEILLARCYYELKDWDSAVAHAESAVRIDPSNAEAHLWLGRTYGRKADQAHSLSLALKTRDEFQKAVALAPGSVEARRDLMEYYLEAPWILGGSKDKARKEAQTIATLDPVEGKLAAAQVAKKSGHLDRAGEEYGNLVSMQLSRIGPYLEAADFYLAHQDIAKFVQAVDAAVKVDAADVRLDYYRGVRDILQGENFQQAERQLKSYIAHAPSRQDFPSHASAFGWLGQLYARSGKNRLAARQYEAALQLDPNLQQARQGLEQLPKQ